MTVKSYLISVPERVVRAVLGFGAAVAGCVMCSPFGIGSDSGCWVRLRGFLLVLIVKI